MYLLTRREGEIDSGVYASLDEDGTSVVQFFVDKDDANKEVAVISTDKTIIATGSKPVVPAAFNYDKKRGMCFARTKNYRC